MLLSATSQDERDLLAQVVQVSAAAIVTADLDGCITSWNAAAERLYGCTAEQAVGSGASDVLDQFVQVVRSIEDFWLGLVRLPRR